MTDPKIIFDIIGHDAAAADKAAEPTRRSVRRWLRKIKRRY